MEIKGDLAQFLSGMPIRVADCNIAISQPSIREISAFGEDSFLSGLHIFIYLDKVIAPIKEGNSRLAMLSDFQVLMATMENDTSIKDGISNLFTLIFPQYIWEFAPGSINFKLKENTNSNIVGQINPMNFENFQILLKELFLPQTDNKDEPDFNPANKAAEEIAAKLKKGREQRAEIQRKEKGDVGSLFANYVSILSVGLAMDINIIYNYTPFQLYDSFKRYVTKLTYEQYQKIIMTPLMDTSSIKEPKNWLENIYI